MATNETEGASPEVPPEEPLMSIDSSTVTLEEGGRWLVFRDRPGEVMFSVACTEINFPELVKFFREWEVIPKE